MTPLLLSPFPQRSFGGNDRSTQVTRVVCPRSHFPFVGLHSRERQKILESRMNSFTSTAERTSQREKKWGSGQNLSPSPRSLSCRSDSIRHDRIRTAPAPPPPPRPPQPSQKKGPNLSDYPWRVFLFCARIVRGLHCRGRAGASRPPIQRSSPPVFEAEER